MPGSPGKPGLDLAFRTLLIVAARLLHFRR